MQYSFVYILYSRLYEPHCLTYTHAIWFYIHCTYLHMLNCIFASTSIEAIWPVPEAPRKPAFLWPPQTGPGSAAGPVLVSGQNTEQLQPTQLENKGKTKRKKKEKHLTNILGFFFLVNIGLRLCLLPSELLRCILTAEGINCCHFLFMTWYRTINCSCSRERSKAVELHEYIPNRKRQARPRSEGETPPGRNLKLVSTSILIRERNKKSASQSQRNTLKKYSELPSKEALIGFTFLIP